MQDALNADILTTIIGLIATIGGVILGAILTQLFNCINEKRNREKEFFLVNYKLRQDAYSQIYIALVNLEKYFKPFINTGISDRTEFAPMQSVNKLIDTFEECKLWLDKETCTCIDEIVSSGMYGCDLALYMVGNESLFSNESIEVICKDIIEKINYTQKYITYKCAMPQVDRYISKVNKIKKAPPIE